jgi:hypothetical protein
MAPASLKVLMPLRTLYCARAADVPPSLRIGISL